MADNSSMDWQRQNFKKSGSEPAQTSLNPKLTQSGVVGTMHSKIATPTHSMGGLVSSGSPEPLKMANGGLVAGLLAGAGAAYMYNKNKDAKKEVGVDKYGFKQTGESEMRSAESDTDKTRVISDGMKPKADEPKASQDDGLPKADDTPAKVDVEPSKPTNSGSSYTGDIGNADNDPVATVKSAPKKTTARPVRVAAPEPKPEPRASQDSAFKSSDEDIAKRSSAATADDKDYGKSKRLKALADTVKGKGSYDPFASPLNKR